MDIEHTEIVPLRERLADELDAAQRDALARGEQIEPNQQERKNGWTAQTLTAYLKERLASQNLALDVDSLHRRFSRRSDVQNHRYNPLRWRNP